MEIKMIADNEKCVLIIDENLPVGVIANTSAILGITMGMKMPDVVGADAADADGNMHSGIIQFPVPVLKGSGEKIKELRNKLFLPEFSDLTVVDFTKLAQSCKTYDEFIVKMAECTNERLEFMGIAICGDKKKINRLTGSMPLLK